MTGKLLRNALLFFLLSLTASLGAANAETLVLAGGTVYSSPDAARLADAVVVTSNGVIIAIGSRFGRCMRTYLLGRATPGGVLTVTVTVPHACGRA